MVWILFHFSFRGRIWICILWVEFSHTRSVKSELLFSLWSFVVSSNYILRMIFVFKSKVNEVIIGSSSSYLFFYNYNFSSAWSLVQCNEMLNFPGELHDLNKDLRVLCTTNEHQHLASWFGIKTWHWLKNIFTFANYWSPREHEFSVMPVFQTTIWASDTKSLHIVLCEVQKYLKRFESV